MIVLLDGVVPTYGLGSNKAGFVRDSSSAARRSVKSVRTEAVGIEVQQHLNERRATPAFTVDQSSMGAIHLGNVTEYQLCSFRGLLYSARVTSGSASQLHGIFKSELRDLGDG